MNKHLLISGMITAAILTSCDTTRTVSADQLSGEWNVAKIEGHAITVPVDQDVPYMAFDVANQRMFGSASCNRIMGNFQTADKGEIDLSGIIATRMMCPQMSLEDSLLTALNQVKTFGLNKANQLVLMDGQHREMVTLDKRADEISTTMLTGSWKVNLLGDLDLSSNEEGDYSIEFLSDGSFSMTTGCNNVGGNYSGHYVDSAVTQLPSTRMMCPNMEVEQAASQLLPKIVFFSPLSQQDTLGFYDAENNLIMTITKMQ